MGSLSRRAHWSRHRGREGLTLGSMALGGVLLLPLEPGGGREEALG